MAGAGLFSSRLAGRGEEAGEQAVDVPGFVLVDQVGGAEQAIDAVEAGHVVVLGLGELGAEVAVAFPPDDQRRRGDAAQRRGGLLRRGPH